MIDTVSHSAGLLLQAMDWIQWILVVLVLLGIPELCRRDFDRKVRFWLLIFLIPLTGRMLVRHAGAGRYFQVLFILMLPLAVLGIEWAVRLAVRFLKVLQRPGWRPWLFALPAVVFCGIFIGRSLTVGQSKPYMEQFARLVRQDQQPGRKVVLARGSIASRVGYYAGCDWLEFRDQVETDRVPLVLQELLEAPEETVLYWVSEYSPEQLREAHPMYRNLTELGRYKKRAFLYRYRLPAELRKPENWQLVKEFTPADFKITTGRREALNDRDFIATERVALQSLKSFQVDEKAIYRLRVEYNIKNGTSTAHFGVTAYDAAGNYLAQETDTPIIGLSAILAAPAEAGTQNVVVSPYPRKEFSSRTVLALRSAGGQEITGLVRNIRKVSVGAEISLAAPLKKRYPAGQFVSFHWAQFGHLLLPEERDKGKHQVTGIAAADRGSILPQLPRGTRAIRVVALLNWLGTPQDEIQIHKLVLEQFVSVPKVSP